MMNALRSLLPPAVRWLLLANVAVFVANALLLGRLSEPARGGWFAFSGTGLLEGYGLGALRLVTYQFTHAFADPLHLLFNMIALWVFGPMVESTLGTPGTVRLYLWGGVAGALGHLALSAWQGHPSAALVGASGACYALLLHAACTMPQATIIFFIVRLPLAALAAVLVGLGVYLTFVELATGMGGGVSHSAHLGGAALGWLAYRQRWFARGTTSPLARLVGALRTAAARHRQRAALARELRLDEILAKVKEQGLGALDDEERRFLAEASRQARR
jgi:membrane associated rhomboid family serine protease